MAEELTPQVSPYTDSAGQTRWYWSIGQRGFTSAEEAQLAAKQRPGPRPQLPPRADTGRWNSAIARFSYWQLGLGLILMLVSEVSGSGGLYGVTLSNEAQEVLWRLGAASFGFGLSTLVLTRFDRDYFPWVSIEDAVFGADGSRTCRTWSGPPW